MLGTNHVDTQIQRSIERCVAVSRRVGTRSCHRQQRLRRVATFARAIHKNNSAEWRSFFDVARRLLSLVINVEPVLKFVRVYMRYSMF